MVNPQGVLSQQNVSPTSQSRQRNSQSLPIRCPPSLSFIRCMFQLYRIQFKICTVSYLAIGMHTLTLGLNNQFGVTRSPRLQQSLSQFVTPPPRKLFHSTQPGDQKTHTHCFTLFYRTYFNVLFVIINSISSLQTHMKISNQLSRIINLIQLSHSQYIVFHAFVYPITPLVKVFYPFLILTIENPNIGINSSSLTFLVPMYANIRPP